MKQQKSYSSEIARCSISEFRKVETEIDLLNNLLNDVENELQKNRLIAEKLKYETTKCFQNVDMAQRTHDTPPGLQYENVAPTKFFRELVDHFDHEMHKLKVQIDSIDKFAKNYQNPNVLGPQGKYSCNLLGYFEIVTVFFIDLALGMRRIHEIFVALAGRLQSVHAQVESQKDAYINFRKRIYNDSSNPFETLNPTAIQNLVIYSPPKMERGPTPFNNITMGNGSAILQPQNQTAPPAYPNTVTSTAPGKLLY